MMRQLCKYTHFKDEIDGPYNGSMQGQLTALFVQMAIVLIIAGIIIYFKK